MGSMPLNALVNDAGTQLSKSALLTLLGSGTAVTKYTVPARIRERFTFPGDSDHTPDGYRLAFSVGDELTSEQIDALYPVATIGTITPATGPAAGGTPITIAGTNFAFGTTVAIGGVACTSVVVVDDETITCVTGAHSAATVNVVVTTPAGAVTKTNGFIYT